MTSLDVSLLVFLAVFSSALLGMFFSRKLPVSNLGSDSKDVVRLGMALVSTTVAVVLGMLISSAKGFYDTQSNEVTQLAANYIVLDRVLRAYGPETTDIRSALRDGLTNLLAEDEGSQDLKKSNKSYVDIESGVELRGDAVERIERLSPKDDTQKSLKAQAENIIFRLGETRWLIFEQNAVPTPRLLLFMLIGWLMILFVSFGLFAPRNFTVLAGMCMAALAVCGAILLILEMYHPQTGLIRVSDSPLRAALAQIGH